MSAMGRAYYDCQVALGYDGELDRSDGSVVWDDITSFFAWLGEHNHDWVFDTTQDIPADMVESFRRDNPAPARHDSDSIVSQV